MGELSGYRVPAVRHRSEDVVERSRFIATVDRASSIEAGRTFVEDLRAEFPDATHNCWAIVAGPPGETAFVAMSDDGEPHGTAGRPMLDVLLHSGIGEVVAVVTRYYGGVKLGKGGLVRAYGGAVQRALASLPTLLLVERVDVTITVAYGDVELLRRLLAETGADVLSEEYGEAVTYAAAVPVETVDDLERGVLDGTAGRGRVERQTG